MPVTGLHQFYKHTFASSAWAVLLIDKDPLLLKQLIHRTSWRCRQACLLRRVATLDFLHATT